MKFKNKTFIKAIAFLLIISIVAGYMLWRTRPYDTSSYQHIIDGYSTDVAEGSEYKKIKNSSNIKGYEVVAENEFLELGFNKETFDVAVYNKETKDVFYTIPKDVEEDAIANGYEKGFIRSHLLVSYFDNARNKLTYLSYTNSVLGETATPYTIENGVRLTYNIGNFDRDITALPQYLTIERADELRSQMDDSGVKLFNKYYYEITEGEYVGFYGQKTNLAGNKINIAKMLDLFDSIGYNDEQLQSDNASAGFEATAAKTQFSISVDFTLKDDKLNINIPNSLITEANGKIAYIDFMPYFLSGSTQDTGSFLLPDGSGSIMEFNNAKRVDTQYVQPVYDFDRENQASLDPMNEEKITMPVFAMSSNKGSVFGRITNGTANAYIIANESQRNNSYNNVYTRFNLRNSSLLEIAGVSGTTNNMTVIEKEMTKSDITIEYAFFDDESNYVDFAKEYRNQLIEEGTITLLEEKENIPLFLDLIGGVSGYTYNFIFGKPGTIVGTTYDEALGIIKDLNENGINNLNVSVKGWFNNGTNNNYAGDIDLIDDLGSKKDLRELGDYLASIGSKLFLETNFIKTSYSDKNFDEARDGSRLLSGYTAIDRPYTVNLFRSRFLSEMSYLNSPGIVSETVESFLKDYKKLKVDSVGINPTDMTSIVVSDKNKKRNIDRVTASLIYEENLGILAESTDLMLTNGNEYSLKYSQNMKDVSLYSNELAITDYSVPFKQIVLHGYVNMAGKAINNSSIISKDDLILKILETGTYPSFIVSEAPTTDFQFVAFNVYNSEYSQIKNEILDIYSEINAVLKNVYNVPIANHTIDGDVVIVEYENGDVIVLNYGDSKVSTKYGSVDKQSYLYEGGEK